VDKAERFRALRLDSYKADFSAYMPVRIVDRIEANTIECVSAAEAERLARELAEARAENAALKERILTDHGKELWAEVLASEQHVEAAQRGYKEVAAGKTVPLNAYERIVTAPDANDRAALYPLLDRKDLGFRENAQAIYDCIAARASAEEATTGETVELRLAYRRPRPDLEYTIGSDPAGTDYSGVGSNE
jgi:hypothetical protein